jgi:hypothetical protein
MGRFDLNLTIYLYKTSATRLQQQDSMSHKFKQDLKRAQVLEVELK